MGDVGTIEAIRWDAGEAAELLLKKLHVKDVYVQLYISV